MGAPPRSGRISSQFADHRRRDRNFVLLMVTLLWLGILIGFVPDIIGR
jgi:predicted nucleic acid-binding Zn ribbon protein